MQLRVARLCLDCEELHTDNSCPRCASESYVFLSSWLPVEERRRWKRSVTAADTDGAEPEPGLGGMIARWIKGDPEKRPEHPTTRASDHVVHLDFDTHDKDEASPRQPRLQPHPSKNQSR